MHISTGYSREILMPRNAGRSITIESTDEAERFTMSSPDDFDSLYANLPKTGTVPSVSANIASTSYFADPLANFGTSFASSQRAGQDVNTGKRPAMSPSSTETPHDSLARSAPTHATSKDEPFPFPEPGQDWRFNRDFHPSISIPERYRILEEEREFRQQRLQIHQDLALRERQKRQNGGGAPGTGAELFSSKQGQLESSNHLGEEDLKKSKKKMTKGEKEWAKREERKARSAQDTALWIEQLAREQQAGNTGKVEKIKKERHCSCPSLGGCINACFEGFIMLVAVIACLPCFSCFCGCCCDDDW